MNKLFFILFSLSFLILAGCAHHRDVRPGVDGIHRVQIQTDDAETGQREAIEQANHYCKERKQEAAFITEDKKYVGDMDESSYNTGKKAAKVAKVVGGSVWGLGGKKESDVGGIAAMGGVAADQALGKGYQVEMKFKCQ